MGPRLSEVRPLGSSPEPQYNLQYVHGYYREDKLAHRELGGINHSGNTIRNPLSSNLCPYIEEKGTELHGSMQSARAPHRRPSI